MGVMFNHSGEAEPRLLSPGQGHRGVLVWEFSRPLVAISSAGVGGGIGPVSWVLNVGVESTYQRIDLDSHAAEIREPIGLRGPGTALFTAVPVERVERAEWDGIIVHATVGVTRPTWPADPAALATAGHRLPGTINVVCLLPVPLTPSALVQAAATVAEAKAQACVEAGVPGTGTCSDALVVCGADPSDSVSAVEFAGVRSHWGARLALAVHEAVTLGLSHHPCSVPPWGRR